MPRFLLDTNALSAMIALPDGPVARKLAGQSDDACCTSIIAAGELRYGAVRKESARITFAVEGVLARLVVMPFDEPADRAYAELRARLERTGRTLSANDLLIAAHALALDCVLVSDDRAFERIAGLTVENWLR